MKNDYKVKKPSGFTIIEVLVTIGLTLIILGILGSIFVNMYHAYNRVEAEFDIERGLEEGVHWLRRDLSETSLNSIVVYPDSHDKMPGVSMISAEEYDETTGRRHFQISRFGTPLWSGHVLYTLVPRKTLPSEVGSPFEGKLGNLVRWYLPFDREKNPVYPFPTTIFPSDFSKQKQLARTVFSGIPLPSAPKLQGFDYEKVHNLNSGGFTVSFIRQERDKDGKVLKETLSDTNPTQTDKPEDMKEISTLVQVNMIIVQFSTRDQKLTALNFPFQVHPRN